MFTVAAHVISCTDMVEKVWAAILAARLGLELVEHTLLIATLWHRLCLNRHGTGCRKVQRVGCQL